MRATRTYGEAPTPEGLLESEDGFDAVRIPASVLKRTFQHRIWDEINADCGTDIDAYELFVMEVSILTKAAKLIRLNLEKDEAAPNEYVTCLYEAARMLESSATRETGVIFSF